MSTRICKNPDCHLAGQQQSFSKFHVNKGGIGGHSPRCKVCVGIYRKERYREAKLGRVINPMPCAGLGMIRRALANEESKLEKDNMKIFSDDVVCIDKVLSDIIDDYKESCLKSIRKLKALLQVPV